MELGIRTRKERLVFLISFSAILIGLAGISHVIAIGSGDYNVHGHDSGELDVDLSSVCMSDGTNCPDLGGEALSCQVYSSITKNANDNTYANCPPGKIATGGGCVQTAQIPADPDLDAYAQWPSSAGGGFLTEGGVPVGWACDSNTAGRTAYAVCCEGGGSGGSSGLDCYIEETTATNPTICCDSGYFATGVNSPELDYRNSWTSTQCIQFTETTSSYIKQVMCCK